MMKNVNQFKKLINPYQHKQSIHHNPKKKQANYLTLILLKHKESYTTMKVHNPLHYQKESSKNQQNLSINLRRENKSKFVKNQQDIPIIRLNMYKLELKDNSLIIHNQM